MFRSIRSQVRMVRRPLALLLLVAGAALVAPSDAWAKAPKEPEAAPVKSYAMPYALVGLGVILGMIVVCRPNNRLNEPKLPVVGKEDL